MKDYYSILKSFFSKNNNQERLDQLERIQGDETALIKLFNQIKPESKDYSINKTSSTMKMSELKAQIREEIIATLSEVTVVDKNTKPEEIKDKDPNTVKSAIDTAKKTNKAVNIAEEEDINELNLFKPILHYIKLGDDSWVKIEYRGTGGDGNYENISNVGKVESVDSSEVNKLKLEDRIKRAPKIGKGSNSQATYGGGQIQATGPLGDTEIRVSKIDNTEDWKSNDIGGAELPKKIQSKITTTISSEKVTEQEEDNYDFDEKEPSKSDMKKDSVATTANKLQKLITKMKALAKEYKQAKESKDEAKVKKITDQLKTMTKEKKQLEKAL